MSDDAVEVTALRHGKARLALWTLRPGSGRPLLVLHGLGERSPAAVPAHLERWPGPVYALDFTGHGASTIPVGGGYFAEMLLADVDAALAQLGEVTVIGRGLGAYVGLLAAGGRPQLVRGVVLDDGPGLAGGGVAPGSTQVPPVAAAWDGPPDPHALDELSRDVRPPDYALEYVRQAMQWSGLNSPIAICAVVRPAWLEAVAAEPGVLVCSRDEALATFAAI